MRRLYHGLNCSVASTALHQAERHVQRQQDDQAPRRSTKASRRRRAEPSRTAAWCCRGPERRPAQIWVKRLSPRRPNAVCVPEDHGEASQHALGRPSTRRSVPARSWASQHVAERPSTRRTSQHAAPRPSTRRASQHAAPRPSTRRASQHARRRTGHGGASPERARRLHFNFGPGTRLHVPGCLARPKTPGPVPVRADRHPKVFT